MAIRILGLLAVLGGAGVAIAAGHFVGLALNAPTVRPWSLMTDPTRAPLMAVVGKLGIAARSDPQRPTDALESRREMGRIVESLDCQP